MDHERGSSGRGGEGLEKVDGSWTGKGTDVRRAIAGYAIHGESFERSGSMVVRDLVVDGERVGWRLLLRSSCSFVFIRGWEALGLVCVCVRYNRSGNVSAIPSHRSTL